MLLFVRFSGISKKGMKNIFINFAIRLYDTITAVLAKFERSRLAQSCARQKEYQKNRAMIAYCKRPLFNDGVDMHVQCFCCKKVVSEVG